MEWINRSQQPCVRFTAAELNEYRHLAQLRCDPRRSKGFNPKKYSRIEANIIGIMGEAAVADLLEVEFDRRFLPNGDGNVEDLNINGWSIQVKTNSKRNGAMIYNHVDDFKSDIAVLVYAEPKQNFAVIAGWADCQTFRRLHKTGNFGYGERVYLEQSDMYFWQDLYLPHKYKPSEEEIKTAFEERAAILEYDGGYSRPEAERLARIEIFGQ